MQLTNDNKYDSERRKELRIDEYNLNSATL